MQAIFSTSPEYSVMSNDGCKS
uniref:Uncharacterized protein n=1 Tax=Rhizophora mucronata TaxID=61149 RepID=A0A2P2N880_RHIMU